jgi:pyruvate formate lyase activating enzyme
LRVGGFTPLTTIDYPGQLAAVVYCQGCPWRCRYCHNGHLLGPTAETLIPWEQITAFLEQRRGLLDAVVFSGGEPTAQRALRPAMSEVRALGFKVGLHTAGPYPNRLPGLLPLLDWVGFDIKALPEDYPLVTGIPASGHAAWRSLRILVAGRTEQAQRSGTPFDLEVRTTVMPGLDSDAYLRRLMGRVAGEGVTCFTLQRCRSQHRLDPALPRQGAFQPDPRGHQTPFQRFSLRGW